jgi:2-keto-4-pentenoate hydratase
MNPNSIARLLADAHREGRRLSATELPVASTEEGYAVQNALIDLLGPHGGWKLGRKDPQTTPHCAPLPQAGIHASGAALPAARFPLRIAEVEVALRVGTDLDNARDLPGEAELPGCFDAVLTAIELVESRIEGMQQAPAPVKLADLQVHGALIVGEPSTLLPSQIDLLATEAELWIGGERAVHQVGGNPAQQLWPMVAWLVRHCVERGLPLRRGQIVTTGSCTGMKVVPAGQPIRGVVHGMGAVELSLD